MKRYLDSYIKYVENNPKVVKPDEILIKLSFFQHERLIHLLITLFYCILFLIFLILITLSYVFIIPAALLLVFLICYLIHYFLLENGVQYLYKLYDKSINIPKKNKKD